MSGSPTCNTRRWAIAPALACLLLALAGCGREEPAASAPPQEVNFMRVDVFAPPLDLQYSARTRGEREVEVHARVSGILLKRYYREGEVVPADALLFRIDPVPFQQEVTRLRGLEAVEKARLDEATAQRDRVLALFERKFVSSHDRDVAVAGHAAALASAQAAKAARERAELDLSYTDVRAPIAGISGLEWRSEGSLVKVGEDSSLLTTIVQADTLLIDFALPETEARLVRAAMAKGPVPVSLTPGGAGPITQQAQLEFIDSRVTTDSGTVWARAVLDNRAARLAPGQFILARIEGLQAQPGIFIPVRAVLQSVDSTIVWIVDAAGKVAPRPVRQGQMLGNLVEVAEGLQAGDRIIVDGVLKVMPGVTVKPLEKSLAELTANQRPDQAVGPVH